jgi:hypothetical protein
VRNTVVKTFRDLDARGTEVLCVFGAFDQGIDHLAEQLGGEMRRLERGGRFVRVVIDGEGRGGPPDHTFTQIWAQDHLTEIVGDHLVARFK